MLFIRPITSPPQYELLRPVTTFQIPNTPYESLPYMPTSVISVDGP